MAHKTIEFDRLVKRTLQDWHIPGLSIAVIQGDEIHAKSYGLADNSGEKCTERTLFDLASCSKATTAGAVALLVDDDKYPNVLWDTPVSKLLPDDFILEDDYATKNITIEDILSHRTGMPRHDNSYLSIRAKEPEDAKFLTRNLRNLQMTEPLRTKYQYNNIMYSVAAHLVETISGTPYPKFLRKHIWEPLCMTNTYHDGPDIDDSEEVTARLATGYYYSTDTSSYLSIPHVYQPEGRGAGGIFSSAADYAKYIQSLLQQTRPLSKAAHKALIKPRTIIDDSNSESDDEDSSHSDPNPWHSTPLYCFGLGTETYRGHTIVDHDGGVAGFGALIRFLPRFNWGVVMLGNASGVHPVIKILAYTLMDDVIGVSEADRVDWASKVRREEARCAEKENRDLAGEKWRVPSHAEPLGVEAWHLVGTYFNAGYKELVLQMRGAKVWADCSDRCYPFELSWTHLTGAKFMVESRDVWEGHVQRLEGEVRVVEGRVKSVGIKFEEVLVWFERVG